MALRLSADGRGACDTKNGITSVIMAVKGIPDAGVDFAGTIEEPLVQAVVAAYQEVTGKEAIYDGVPGATDGTFLMSRKNIPVVVTGSGVREVPHQYDEWVDIDQLIRTTHLYALTILKYLNSGI